MACRLHQSPVFMPSNSGQPAQVRPPGYPTLAKSETGLSSYGMNLAYRRNSVLALLCKALYSRAFSDKEIVRFWPSMCFFPSLVLWLAAFCG